MGIAAIETRYKGHRFRSRLEARYAVFFDALGIPWEYEKEGYDLESAGYYLPDFWLPQQSCFVEIKGEEPTAKELHKCSMLNTKGGFDVFLFSGMPTLESVGVGWFDEAGESSGGLTYSENCAFFHCQRCCKVFIDDCRNVTKNSEAREYIGRVNKEWLPLSCACGGWIVPEPLIENAMDAARSARFEHGECG